MHENPTHPCQVCSHPDRLAIEAALASGKGQVQVCRQFGIGSGVFGTDTFKPDHKKLGRHEPHMAQSYRVAKAGHLLESGNALVDRLAMLNRVVDESLDRLTTGVEVRDEHGVMLDSNGNPIVKRDERAILAAVSEARRNVEVEARLMGALPEGDPDAAEQARLALMDPVARRLVREAEEHLARAADGA